MNKLVIAIAMLFAGISLGGCATFTVIMGDETDPSLVFEEFKKCPGTSFKITVTELGPGGQPGKTTESTGIVAAGSVKFSGLKDVNPGGLFLITITNTSERDCGPFKAGKTYSTEKTGIQLTPRRDPNKNVVKDVYEVDVNKFK